MTSLLENRPTLYQTRAISSAFTVTPVSCAIRWLWWCPQGTNGGYDHDSDADMIIDESQLSIGGMSDGTPLDQALSATGQGEGTGRKEVLQVSSLQGAVASQV